MGTHSPLQSHLWNSEQFWSHLFFFAVLHGLETAVSFFPLSSRARLATRTAHLLLLRDVEAKLVHSAIVRM